MPFLLETELKAHGGVYDKAEQSFGVKVVVSGRTGNLVTGQNPPSAVEIGKVLVTVIDKLKSSKPCLV